MPRSRRPTHSWPRSGRVELSLTTASHLLNGTLPSSLYLAYIDKLREIYTALEDAVALHPSHPHLSTTYNPSLLVRAPLLQSDCDYFLGEGVLPVLQVQVQGEDTGVQEYVERLRKLGTEDQESATLLLGHTYVRYRMCYHVESIGSELIGFRRSGGPFGRSGHQQGGTQGVRSARNR